MATTNAADREPGLRLTDPEDARVLIAALHAFSLDADQQASDEAGWLEADVPTAHVALLRDWAERARVLCAQAEDALASEPEATVR